MVRKVPERAALPITSDPALRAALLDVLQQDGYAINQLLGAFESGTWTPTFTFATPGDLSVAYTVQEGSYWRIGALLFIVMDLRFTPTFGTSSGNAQITGLPYAPLATGPQFPPLATSWDRITLPGGRTDMGTVVIEGETFLRLAAYGSAAAAQTINASDFTSAAAHVLRAEGFYPADFEHP